MGLACAERGGAMGRVKNGVKEKEPFQLTCQVRVDCGPRKSDSAFWVTGFTKYE